MNEYQPSPTLPEYHQERIVRGVDYLSSRPNETIVLASYTHPGYDIEQRVVVGDVLWNALEKTLPPSSSMHNLVWEPMPAGFNNCLELVLPYSGELRSTKISSGYSTLPWWNADESSFVNETGLKINQGLQDAKSFLSESDLSKNPLLLNRMLEKLSLLRELRDAVSAPDQISHPVDYYGLLYQQLVSLTFGKGVRDSLPIKQAYSQSDIIRLTNIALQNVHTEVGLGNALGRYLTQGQSALWIGGDHNQLSYIGFSTERMTFTATKVGPVNGRRLGNIKNIPEQEVVDMLDGNNTLPTGKISLLGLLHLSQQNHIWHVGNEYGIAERIKEKLFPDQETHYYQVFEDFQNTWPVVRLNTKNNEPMVPSLSALYLLTDNPSYNQQLLNEAVKTGTSIDMDFQELIRL